MTDKDKFSKMLAIGAANLVAKDLPERTGEICYYAEWLEMPVLRIGKPLFADWHRMVTPSQNIENCDYSIPYYMECTGIPLTKFLHVCYIPPSVCRH